MNKILTFMACLSLAVSTLAQNITKIEYFIDADPGYGAGVDVPVSAANVVTANFTVALPNTVADGFHFLSIRAKDENNNWSVVGIRPFYKETISTSILPNITKLEYFIDTDPGYGMATDIPITASGTVAQSFMVALTNTVADGFHFLSIRAKDENNNWSVVGIRPFYKEPENNSVSIPNITALEYFIDADPGYGSGVSVPVIPFTRVLPSFLVNLAGQSEGIHSLSIRAKDENNKWSIVGIRDIMVNNSFVEITALPPTWCRSSLLPIPFTTVGNFGAGNVFTAQLSNSAGAFTSPTSVGTLAGTGAGTINATIPAGIGLGAGYQLRIVASNPNIVASASLPIEIVSTCNAQIVTGTAQDPANTNGNASISMARPMATNNVPLSPDEYLCTGQTVVLPFTTYGTFDAGNIFTLQLSDQNGENFTTIPATYSNNTFTFDIPVGINTGDSYRMRVLSSSPAITGTEAILSLKILKDIIPPTIMAPANVNTVTNTACTATGVVLSTPKTADNCEVNTVTNNAPTAYPLGDTSVTWTVTDKTGNVTTATQIVTVTDNVPPTINGIASLNLTTPTCTLASTGNLGNVLAIDNCEVLSLTNDAPTQLPLGTTVISWTATDIAGNTQTATQTVTVVNNCTSLQAVAGGA